MKRSGRGSRGTAKSGTGARSPARAPCIRGRWNPPRNSADHEYMVPASGFNRTGRGHYNGFSLNYRGSLALSFKERSSGFVGFQGLDALF